MQPNRREESRQKILLATRSSTKKNGTSLIFRVYKLHIWSGALILFQKVYAHGFQQHTTTIATTIPAATESQKKNTEPFKGGNNKNLCIVSSAATRRARHHVLKPHYNIESQFHTHTHTHTACIAVMICVQFVCLTEPRFCVRARVCLYVLYWLAACAV